jgi:hypothetical protein
MFESGFVVDCRILDQELNKGQFEICAIKLKFMLLVFRRDDANFVWKVAWRARMILKRIRDENFVWTVE